MRRSRVERRALRKTEAQRRFVRSSTFLGLLLLISEITIRENIDNSEWQV
jgi:hypothetical protein